MNKFKAAEIEALTCEKKALHGNDITWLALEHGILEKDGATPESSMIATLSIDIKNHGSNSEFVRVFASTIKLNNKKKREPNINTRLEKDKEIEELILVESSFTGKAGEHLICSELVFRRYNASIMRVYVGMHIAVCFTIIL